MIRSFLEILFTPSCWSRNYKTNADYDDFIRKLIEQKDKVKCLFQNDYRIDLKYRNSVISLWLANKWYAYLQSNQTSITVNGKPVVLYPRDVMPSRKTCFDFYREFELRDIGKKGRFDVDIAEVSKMIFGDETEGKGNGTL